MSNFSRERLHELYEIHENQLKILVDEVKQAGVYLTINVSSDGGIELSSREYFTDEGKEFVSVHTYKKSEDSSEDSSRVTFLRNLNSGVS